MNYFALQSNGEFFELGDHGDLEAAKLTALDQYIDAVWIADSKTVEHWKAYLEKTKIKCEAAVHIKFNRQINDTKSLGF